MNRLVALALLTICVASARTHAASVTAYGAVTALTDVTQLGTVTGTAGFEEGVSFLPSNTYAAQGMVLRGTANGIGENFSSFFPGIVSSGRAILPLSSSSLASSSFFPPPILGGGTIVGHVAHLGMVATFTKTINQFGLTMSQNQIQYLTAWRANGTLIGSVQWNPGFLPNGEGRNAGFVGLDTGHVPIAMIAVGNDFVFLGEQYEVSGVDSIFDNAIWANRVPEPASLQLTACAGLLLMLRGLPGRARSGVPSVKVT